MGAILGCLQRRIQYGKVLVERLGGGQHAFTTGQIGVGVSGDQVDLVGYFAESVPKSADGAIDCRFGIAGSSMFGFDLWPAFRRVD
jgi:hypothetical protein